MKLSVEFPSIAYREGPEAIVRLARAIEEIGYEQIDIFDHVVMGYPAPGRPDPVYPPKMPILEAFMTLSYIAASTSRIGLGTEVLVLPQRQPVLVAKQLSTLDTLSGGRTRLGVGVGWQESEFEALGEDFKTRGRRMDEAIRLIRACWGDEQVDFAGEFYRINAMAMEPKPVQGDRLPIWIGGASPRSLERTGTLGDGWLAGAEEPEVAARLLSEIRGHAEAANRDPASISAQMMLNMPPRSEGSKDFYRNPSAVLERANRIAESGFDWISLNATEIFQAGARSVDAMINQLGELHETLRSELGSQS
jgi:probable F420-dependent oxidoreductase